MAIASLYIKERYVNVMRVTLLVVFSIIAMIFSLFLFWSFPDKDYLRPIYAVFGFFWELGNLFFAIQLKTAVVLKKPQLLGWLIGYLVFVGISTLGGIGFNLATTGNQAVAQRSQAAAGQAIDESRRQYRITLQAAIDQAAKDVKTYSDMLPLIPADNLNRIKQVTGWKNDAVVGQQRAAADLKRFDDEQRTAVEATVTRAVSSQETADIFGALGSLVGASSGEAFRKIFFVFIVIVIQAIILVSSPTISSVTVDQKSNKNLLRFIDGLFEEGRGKQLASPYRVAKKLGLDARERDRYFEMLSAMTYRGEPLLKLGRAGTSTDYDPVIFKKIVLWLLEHPLTAGAAAPAPEETAG